MSLIIPANSAAASGGYAVDNSARFNDASDTYLNKTFGSSGNRKTFTISFWIKKCVSKDHGQADGMLMLGGQQDSYPGFLLMYNRTTDTLIFRDAQASNNIKFDVRTDAKFRDFSAWSHIVIAMDTTQGTASNRIKVYINGTQTLDLNGNAASGGGTDTPLYPDQNFDSQFNSNEAHFINKYATNYEDFYLSEYCFIDGTQNAVTDFGEFDDSGIWKPIDVSGLTFGTNGFYLDFKDSSALGNDANGSNNWTSNNFTAIDQSTDTCTNNFCTLSPLWNSFNQGTLSEGNLKSSMTSGVYRSNLASFGVSQGKFYWEIKLTQASNMNFHVYGVSDESTNKNIDFKSLTGTTAFNNTTGKMLINGSEDGSASAVFAQGDIVGIALNMDDKQISIYKNGSALHSNVAMSSTSNVVFPFHIAYTYATYIFEYNFGSPPFAISSGNTDGDGYGNFEYAVPSGYYSLNTKNLAEYG